jgi:hypothetical protein
MATWTVTWTSEKTYTATITADSIAHADKHFWMGEYRDEMLIENKLQGNIQIEEQK